MRRFAMFIVTFLLTIAAAPSAQALTDSEMHSAYVRQEVGRYGPLNCGISVTLFRVETTKLIKERIAAQSREDIFATPDGKPYPFEQLYPEDLIRVRDLLGQEAFSNPRELDERIRVVATTAYERVKSEGRLK